MYNIVLDIIYTLYYMSHFLEQRKEQGNNKLPKLFMPEIGGEYHPNHVITK